MPPKKDAKKTAAKGSKKQKSIEIPETTLMEELLKACQTDTMLVCEAMAREVIIPSFEYEVRLKELETLVPDHSSWRVFESMIGAVQDQF